MDHQQQQWTEQQQDEQAVQQLYNSIDELLHDESKEMRTNVALAVSAMSGQRCRFMAAMPKHMLGDALRKLAQQPAGGLCVCCPSLAHSGPACNHELCNTCTAWWSGNQTLMHPPVLCD
jgi:hypothetical protein